ncbi:NAD(P)/FAD-dependent oxidoreductase [Aeromicrobium wangtongii]|uniref:NAD(P)/FAD-dependent oxidoreductase n=1 Tax=Aeromicrobium wangtongii TaxID=2969247 RepID=UPI002017B567|nr:NAD(P)/FAD-dependent oxidoreductase [Aeromicrobium wangtongii]MCL3818278.1 NAD(P)/FAD-dependent oxidoreductase [Aeromicrobium wangtongii]
MKDTIVIGGGPAGLQAALTLGRMRRDVLLVDSGDYRNASVEHAHNFITNDGLAPSEIREQARKEVAAYPTVEQRSARVQSVAREGDGFVAYVDGETVHARTVILATGMRDTLPDVPGLADVWGVEAGQCPFCHGYEIADRTIAVHGVAAHTAMFVTLLRNLSDELVVLPDGDQIDDDTQKTFDDVGVRVVPGTIRSVDRAEGGVRIAAGDQEVLAAGLFVTPTFEQSAPFAEQLGLDMLPSGAIEIDVQGNTSVPGVYAAGDLAHVAELPMPRPSLLGAAAAGLVAGSTAVHDLLGG